MDGLPAVSVLREWRQSIELAAAGAVVVAATLLTLFTHQEISGETWGYWFFARVLSESGEFVAPDRSPLYTLYLSGFRWLGYPLAVTVEQVVSGVVVVLAIITLLRRDLGLGVAVIGGLVWLPFLQFAEPPLQKLGLACIIWGLVARRSTNPRFALTASYLLFFVAYLSRPTFAVFILLFAAWDIWRVVRGGMGRDLLDSVRSRKSILTLGLPLVLVIASLSWFGLSQSSHRWNTPGFATTTWSPIGNDTSLASGHLIQGWNVRYIEQEYGSFEDRDWYFTNQELFDGAASPGEALRSNPGFILGLTLSNIKPFVTAIAKFTELRYAPFLRVWDVLLIVALLAALYGAARDTDTRIFVIASILVLAVSAAVIPDKQRHFVVAVPLLLLAATWVGAQSKSLMSENSRFSASMLLWAGIAGVVLTLLYYALRAAFAPQPGLRTLWAVLAMLGASAPVLMAGLYRYGRIRSLRWVGLAVMVLPVVLLANGSTGWAELVDDIRQGTITVLEDSGAVSMKASFTSLEPLVENCEGVMALEHAFVAAFMDIPLERVYDIMEIPPFGRLGDSEYDGLRPDRIDCVLVSERMATAIGAGSNVQIRYEGYIEPYVKELKEMGARVYSVDRFGEVIVLEDKE